MATEPSSPRTPSRTGLPVLAEPIINAPMAGAAGGALAAAVSRAGGLGMVGIGGEATPQWIHEQAVLAAAPDLPWGAGLMAWVLESSLDPVRVLLDHSPALICVSFGDPGPAAELARAAGVATAMQVGNAAELRRALEDDIDVVVCRGGEGGGHGRNEAATLPLLQWAFDATDKPVVAAGGIATARGVAAVLAAGAAAAWVGTRFAACSEALGKPQVKEAISSARLDGTVYTRAFDIAQGIPWPREYGGRALRNDFSGRWAGHEAALEAAVAADPGIRDGIQSARAAGDASQAPVYAGEGAGLGGPGSAAELVAELAGFRGHLARAAHAW
ncbi:NAD(P)H-dependent flavin oxidoreductase [Zafaria sp. Z1313]|uniref:NAD(P)H-dependent flavin oxidoreductase n=1 Tax=unclassified Zafaria TaxID=2828765 RepID=UPI002E76293D|nr:nitronate monooxygenase [Zafaria sp. J156]MEE1621395.1 nitronate monooxygenase [Zafaria sp. J156]